MQNSFYNANGTAIAINFKVASATLARAIIRDFQPEDELMLTTPHGNGNGTAYPEGKSAETVLLHGLANKLENPEHALLLVREPVEKFRSACSMSQIGENGRMTVDEKLTQLEAEGFKRDAHFWPQSRFLSTPSLKLYRLEHDLDALATEAGLSLPLPTVNESGTIIPFPKPDLTPEQLARVQAIYADDIELYNSITEAGQAYIAPVEPVSPAVLTAMHSEMWQSFNDWAEKETDINSRTSISLILANPASTQQQIQRCTDWGTWWAALWYVYSTKKQQLLATSVMPVTDFETEVGHAPWTIWEMNA